MKIAIIQNCHGILSIGDDLSDALVGAENTGHNVPYYDDIEIARGALVDGQVYWAQITDALAAEVERAGGDVPFELADGLAMTPEELEEVQSCTTR